MKVNLRVRERRDRQNVLGPVDTHVLLTHQTRCALLVPIPVDLLSTNETTPDRGFSEQVTNETTNRQGF
jgi:hypothetical protein